jgi:hypothetical protein
VFLNYDTQSNLFLPGTRVALTDQATQCLTDFSLDFERTSPNHKDGPDLTVGSVLVNGAPAAFTFVQPTYPGDPNGQNDPDPRAHEARELNPVGGPDNNPLPPACTPELMSTNPSKQFDLDGTQCPANKLVITPASPIASGAQFVVTVFYTGRPGVHNDGDGTTEGWFRVNQPGDAGSFVTTEPVASEAWMPLNNHPSSKPTYDIYDTVPLGKTAIGNGELVSQLVNLPDANFPGGSTTWHWHSPEGVASYLVENSIGSYDLTERLSSSGIQFYEAQDLAIPKNRAAANKAIMDLQEDVLNFQVPFNGAYPFTTDGVVIGVPNAGFEEEMQTKITFSNESIDLDTLHHENMHQWWGDNVSGGELQPHLLQGRVGDIRRVPVRRAQRADGCRRVERGLRTEPRRQLQPVLRGIRPVMDRCTLRSASVHALLRFEDVRPAGHLVHRAAPNPRAGELRGRAAADPEHVPAGKRHRSTARIGVRVVPAVADRLVPCGADGLLHRVVGHRLSARRWSEPAADHRAGARRRRLRLLIRARKDCARPPLRGRARRGRHRPAGCLRDSRRDDARAGTRGHGS